ncbi:MAG: RNA polymerase sigma factor SigZ [Limisphaerales bacterium]
MNTNTTEQIWELLSDRLRSFLRQRVSDEQLAEDLLQETFLRIHKRIAPLDDSRRITSWVFQIARNLVVDHYRVKSRTLGESMPDEPAAVEDETGNLNELVGAWLPDMIGRLPDGMREAVELYELKGLSQQEIADRLEISLSGAKSRIQRGRERVRAMLLECCSLDQDSRGNVLAFETNDPNACSACEDC